VPRKRRPGITGSDVPAASTISIFPHGAELRTAFAIRRAEAEEQQKQKGRRQKLEAEAARCALRAARCALRAAR